MLKKKELFNLIHSPVLSTWNTLVFLRKFSTNERKKVENFS